MLLCYVIPYCVVFRPGYDRAVGVLPIVVYNRNSCIILRLANDQVVPDALLDFCFNVMRSAFSVTLNRPVYAFKFDRFMEVTPAILDKVRLCGLFIVCSQTSGNCGQIQSRANVNYFLE